VKVPPVSTPIVLILPPFDLTIETTAKVYEALQGIVSEHQLGQPTRNILRHVGQTFVQIR
jgi:hypothetical protein